tara:strand:+ start:497 stop:637 length:141 start_codon:yes stop_codon:yes gene_type:complete
MRFFALRAFSADAAQHKGMQYDDVSRFAGQLDKVRTLVYETAKLTG